jgi:hypothetical protein
MPAQRIKGQEVSIIITRDGALEAELTDVKSCEFTPQFEIKTEGYLGEKSVRNDEIYMGVKGSLELHIHSGDVFDFVQAVKDRAQRNTPDTVFNIAGIFAFPSGEVRTLTVPDAKFGAVPISTNDRGDYTSVKFEYAADDYQVATG